MLVDAVISHWVTLVAGDDAVPDGFEQAVQWLVALFYSDDSLLASPRPARTQAVMYVLTGMLDRMGLQTNVNKTVGMRCQPCYIADGHLEAAYEWQMTGVGPSFRERQQERVKCPDCELELAAGFIEVHRHEQHGNERHNKWET